MRIVLASIFVVIFAVAGIGAALPALGLSPRGIPMVFFGANQADLPPPEMQKIKFAVQDFEQEPQGTRVQVVGHTDTAEQNRLALSQRRAETVKDALVREGISAKSIVIEGRGDSDLLVPTRQGVDEPQNRRAEIRFIRP